MIYKNLTCFFIIILTIGSFIDPVSAIRLNDDDPPTVILISIDGLRADYLNRVDTPNLLEIAKEGILADYLEPVFPSKTFPNHYSIITGLYPANHGIVSNSIYDPEIGLFRLSDREMIAKSEWWGGEPLWVTVQKQGRTSATYFWPGSDTDSIQGMQPTYRMEYDDDLPHSVRIDSVMAAVKRTPRPALITTYFSVVDTWGHRSGPHSNETRAALQEVDSHIANLVHRLRDEGIYEGLNLVVLGDHGMAKTSKDQVEFIDDYISMDDVFRVGGLDALGFFNLKDSTQQDSLLRRLNEMKHIDWYTQESLPGKWHYFENDRIPDIIGLAEEGWLMSTRELYDRNPDYYSGGTHGYDPGLPSMHAAFIARGPQFRQNVEVEGFSLIHIYELLCAALNLEPAQNDGNLDQVAHLLKTEANPEDVESPEAIVQAVYDVISTPAGEAVDWKRWHTLFIPEAKLIALGTNAEEEDGYSEWTPDEFREATHDYFESNPFFEVEISQTSEQFGNMTHRFSTYASYRSLDDPDEVPFQRGINSIQLLHMDDRWWVVTIYWQHEIPRFPLPAKYLPEE